MKKILYIYPINTSFVQTDLQLLSKHYAVHTFSFAVKSKIFTPIAFLRQFFFLLFQLPGAVCVVSQFSGYHSFLPSVLCKIFNCKHFIIVHGTECNNFPEYRYGYKMRPFLFWFSKKSLALASLILPVSDALIEQDYSYKETAWRKQGLRAFYPGMTTPTQVIHNGVLADRFNILADTVRNKNSFVTVASGLDDPNRRGIKGLDLVCELAEKMPTSTFTFIGGVLSADLKLPENITVIPPVPNEALQAIYNQHQFYVQFSVSEGFGISVVEAMLCGCIPLVSNVGILPSIAGDFGFVLLHKDIRELEQLVHEAQQHSAEISIQKMRESVISRFSIELREKALLNCLG